MNDGIPDQIELNGIFDPQGNLVANLVQMGAESLSQDCFSRIRLYGSK